MKGTCLLTEEWRMQSEPKINEHRIATLLQPLNFFNRHFFMGVDREVNSAHEAAGLVQVFRY
jgi:hypothetical protein